MAVVGVVFAILLLLNMPLAFTIGIASSLFFINNDNVPYQIAVQRMTTSTQSFPLLAVPFFVMAGHMMNETGITKRLINFAKVLTGHMAGGLAQVSLVLSALMGGISGSANADAAMEARVLGPSMVKEGYSKAYIAGVIGVGSLITATIPPSIGLILYGFVGEVSIGKLFVGGIVPGVLMTVFMMITTSIIAKKRGYVATLEKRASFKEVMSCLKDSIWALIFPLILIIGIRFGIFTASEAGAFAVVYAIIVGIFAYKEINFEGIKRVLKNTVIDNGIIMLIIICSGIFGYITVYDRLPQTMAELITGITTNPQLLILIILGFLFVAGMFMEATVNTLLLTPIFLPIIKAAGIDPVHFGLCMMTVITMGGMTPPVGVTMYTVCSLLDCPTEKYVVESIPYIVTVLVLVILMALFPQIIMWLPNLVM